MRIFKNYAPKLIAKYVSAFFKGTFYIQGLGAFTFDKGKVVINRSQDMALIKIAKEINNFIIAINNK